MNTKLYGQFTSDGNNKVLELGVEVQDLTLKNYTQSLATNNGYGYEYYWQQGMGTESFMDYHPAGDTTAARTIITTGINQVDTFNYAIGPSVVATAGTDVVGPVYSTGSTAGMSTGTIVRIVGSDQVNLNGLDFSVDTVIANTSFTLANDLANAPGITAHGIGGNFAYKILAPNREVYDAIFPAKRVIADISQAASAVVTTLVDHGYSVGQLARINVPSPNGMVEMNGLVGKVTAITAGTFTIDINSTAFSAFTFPLFSVPEFTPAMVVPNGDTLTLGFDGSKRNTAFRGFVLSAGTILPAGNNGDVIHWTATKAASVTL